MFVRNSNRSYRLRLRGWRGVAVALILPTLVLPVVAAAQASPFLTGATALQYNILAWLTPIAVILIMVLGAMAMAPMFSVRWASVIGVLVGRVFVVAGRWLVNGVQWAPPSSDRQMPPLAAVTKMRFGLVGSTATPEMRPLTTALSIVPPLSSAAGQIAVQFGV